MFDGFWGGFAAFWGAFDEAELHEVGLVEIFDCGGFVAGEGSNSGETDGAVAVVFDHEAEHVSVGGI